MRFLRSLHAALEHERRYRGGELTAAAGVAAFDPARALRERCLVDLPLSKWLTLGECLEAGRLPYDRRRAAQAARERAEAEARERLLANIDELQAHLYERRHSLRQYLEPLGGPAARAFRLAIESAEALAEAERAAIVALARSLGDELIDLRSFGGSWTPTPELQRAAASLAAYYRAVQETRVAALVRRHGEGPRLRRATARLAAGQFFDVYELGELADAAAGDEQGRARQQRARLAYLKLREREARRLAREEGLLRRFATPREEFYPRVDRDSLKFCSRCREVAYPALERAPNDPYARRPELRCHYCDAPGLAKFDPACSTDADPVPEAVD